MNNIENYSPNITRQYGAYANERTVVAPQAETESKICSPSITRQVTPTLYGTPQPRTTSVTNTSSSDIYLTQYDVL